MEIPAEALGAAGIAISAVVGVLWRQLVDRVKKLEGALAADQQFIRETLVGLVYDGTNAMDECNRCTRRHMRTVEILRGRYGDAVLQDTHNAMQQAATEQAETDRHTKTAQPVGAR